MTEKYREEMYKRFDSKLSPEPMSGCWLWMGTFTPEGYGQICSRDEHDKQKQEMAHRVAYTRFVGEIPKGYVIDHKCRNASCCNPAHLEAVTNSENLLRGLGGRLKPRATHCINGHEYTDENTFSYRVTRLHRSIGIRVEKIKTKCRKCRAIYAAGLRARKKQAQLNASTN